MKIVAIAVLLCLSGCALFGQNPSLSPEQLKAIASDNKGSVVCMSSPMMGGVAKAVVINLDETRNIDGSVSVEGNCDKLTVNTATLPPAPKASVAIPKAAP